jgi:hypothetical protein
VLRKILLFYSFVFNSSFGREENSNDFFDSSDNRES